MIENGSEEAKGELRCYSTVSVLPLEQLILNTFQKAPLKDNTGEADKRGQRKVEGNKALKDKCLKD